MDKMEIEREREREREKERENRSNDSMYTRRPKGKKWEMTW